MQGRRIRGPPPLRLPLCHDHNDLRCFHARHRQQPAAQTAPLWQQPLGLAGCRLPHRQRSGGRAPEGVPGAAVAYDRRRRPAAGKAVAAPDMALPHLRRAALLSPLLSMQLHYIIHVQQLYIQYAAVRA